MLVDRDAAVGDALCGGFLSWKTAERLASLGIDPAVLGGHEVRKLAVFAGGPAVEADLPHACAKSRLQQALTW